MSNDDKDLVTRVLRLENTVVYSRGLSEKIRTQVSEEYSHLRREFQRAFLDLENRLQALEEDAAETPVEIMAHLCFAKVCAHKGHFWINNNWYGIYV